MKPNYPHPKFPVSAVMITYNEADKSQTDPLPIVMV